MKINDIAWKSFRPDKTKNKGPALTIGVKRVSEGILITFAACSPKDIFSRKIARKITEGRLAQFKNEQRGQTHHLFNGTTFYVVGHFLWLIPRANSEEPEEFEYRGKCLSEAAFFLKSFIPESSLRNVRWLKEITETLTI